jgi:hypothetical protein
MGAAKLAIVLKRRLFRGVVTMNEREQLARIKKLRISNFETVKKVQRLQTDMLARLERSSVDPDRYAGLDDCRANYCGRVNCLEACPFGARRRRLNDIPAIYDLLRNSKAPLCEVRFVRGPWVVPSRSLEHAPLDAAKKLNSRSLDKLFIPTLVAVGVFKVSVEQLYDGYQWIYEVHEIVAGAEKDALEKALSSNRCGPGMSSKLWVQEVSDLGQTISKVFRCDLETWRNPLWKEDEVTGPTKAQRRQFYTWLFDLRTRARLIRYGCDQHFNKLEKGLRTFRATVRKPRPYPYHLKRYMFGARDEDGEDRYDPDENPEDVLKVRTPTDRMKRWFPGVKKVDRKRHFDFRARPRRRR